MKARIPWVILCALMVLTLVLASCSGGTTTTAPATTSAPTTSATSAPPSSTTAKPPTTTATAVQTTPPSTTTKPVSSPTPTGLVAKKGGVLKIITGAPANLGVPWAPNNPPDLFYACPAVETLLRTNDKGDPIAWLATDWKVASDFKSLTMTLRKGVKFHDGTDFNAAAVKYNLETQAKSPMPELKSITSVDVVDDSTVKINVSRWEPQMLSFFAVGRPGWMVSPTAAQKMTQEQMLLNPVGTGPFKFESFKRDVAVNYTRFDNYWQPGKPYLDGIEYEIISDPVTAIIALKSGAAHVHYNISPKEGSDLQKEGMFNIVSAQASVYQWVPDSANASSPWSKLAVRQAAQHAIDTVAMSRAQGYGWTQAYWNNLFPIGNPANDPTIKGYPYDVAKAKQLLADAGYPNGFKTSLYVNVPPVGDLEPATQNYLRQVGIEATIVPLPGASYSLANTTGWQNGMFRSQTPASLGADPGYALGTYLTSPPRSWFSLLRPKDTQDLLDKALAEFDMAKRAQAYRDVCKNVIDTHALVIGVWGGALLAAKSKECVGDTIRSKWTMTWTPEEAWLNR